MWIISRKKLVEAAARHGDLAAPLDAWFRVAKQASWRSLHDVRRTWAKTDHVGTCTVFNIKGNEYRLIAWVNYQSQKIFIRHVLTHAEYDKGGWKHDCAGD
ncbi:MAG TPA: type II toxin-antitoxin system HigB family toxin [Terriglobales bacterium]|nr:type II toxin-antitoxin system HigB family toxin [Terriglobales bacterium]